MFVYIWYILMCTLIYRFACASQEPLVDYIWLVGCLVIRLACLRVASQTIYMYISMYVYLIVCHIGCSMRQLCTQNEHDCINAALSLLTK